MQRAANAYFQTQVTTTSQGDLVVMLYDAALNFLSQAKEGLAANNMAAKGIAISKALDILNELDTALNPEVGGELVNNLRGLYCFCTNHLVKANLKKDAGMIDDVVRILSGLRSAYAQIAELPEAQAAAQQAAERLQVAGSSARTQSPAVHQEDETAPAPAAAARGRGLYARQARAEQGAFEAQEQDPAGQRQDYAAEDQERASPAAGARTADQSAAPATPQVPLGEADRAVAPAASQTNGVVASAPASPAAAPGQAAEQADDDPVDELLSGGFAPSPSLHRKAAGADLYRRFSGQ